MPRVLTINTGSSSLKAGEYDIGGAEVLVATVTVEGIGTAGGRLLAGGAAATPLGAIDHAGALSAVVEWLRGRPAADRLDVVSHRVVHGGEIVDPQIATPALLANLRALVPIDPDHLPQAIAAIETLGSLLPEAPQVVCFDTAFHRTLPPVARMYPLPRTLTDPGHAQRAPAGPGSVQRVPDPVVRRYGFHGLSCEFIVSALREIDPPAAGGRLVIAHLGNGASLTAVREGASVETTMGFSPTGGIMMGRRSGDLDPGALIYALRERRLTPDDLSRLVNLESGLLGVSGTTSDMRDLLAREARDPRAAAAVALFCYLAKKALGGLLAVLGGLDTLVFTGGIGEHAAPVRARIVDGLEAFGLAVDPDRNREHAAVISPDAAPATVRVMATNEDLVLARHAREALRIGT